MTPTARLLHRIRRIPRPPIAASLSSAPPTARPGRAIRQARKAVLYGMVLFVIGQALFNLAVRKEWLPVRDPVYHEKITLLRQRPAFYRPAPGDGPQLVLAIGSSRTHLGFDAGRFARILGNVEAFNFACPASGPMTSALYLRRLLDEGVKPDGLFVELHPGFLTPHQPPFEGQWLHSYRLRPEEIGHLNRFGWAVPVPPQHRWTSWLTAATDYRFALLNCYFPVMLPCPYGLTVGSKNDEFGYVAGIELPAADRPKALMRAHEQYAPIFADYDVGGPGCAAVRDILTLCRENGIKASVVLMPEADAFRVWYGKTGNEAIGRFALSIGEEFGIPAIDARDWVPDDGFSDGHHMTAAGGATFTERLAEVSRAWLNRREEQ